MHVLKRLNLFIYSVVCTVWWCYLWQFLASHTSIFDVKHRYLLYTLNVSAPPDAGPLADMGASDGTCFDRARRNGEQEWLAARPDPNVRRGVSRSVCGSKTHRTNTDGVSSRVDARYGDVEDETGYSVRVWHSSPHPGGRSTKNILYKLVRACSDSIRVRFVLVTDRKQTLRCF